MLCLGLVTHLPDDGRRWADPEQFGIDNGLREIRVLGEEAVARMNGVRLALLRGLDDGCDVKVGFTRGCTPDTNRRVGLAHMHGVAVRV